jgi:hypothetical protein
VFLRGQSRLVPGRPPNLVLCFVSPRRASNQSLLSPATNHYTIQQEVRKQHQTSTPDGSGHQAHVLHHRTIWLDYWRHRPHYYLATTSSQTLGHINWPYDRQSVSSPPSACRSSTLRNTLPVPVGSASCASSWPRHANCTRSTWGPRYVFLVARATHTHTELQILFCCLPAVSAALLTPL